MRLDVFTQVPHAFAWMTEQRPLAAVLGTELELRLFNYRDTTPLRSGQVDDEPYGGGAGMVLRVDVVAAALEAVYGGEPEHRVIALTPQGRPLTQAVVEELAAEQTLTLLSSRFEGFDERIVTHLCSDAISIGPYVLSGGELPAMVLLDAIARRLPGALAEGSGEHESFSVELEGGLEYPHYTRPAEFRGWQVPDVLLSGDHGRVDEWRREQSRERSAHVSDREDEGGRRPGRLVPPPGRVVPAADRLPAAARAAAGARARRWESRSSRASPPPSSAGSPGGSSSSGPTTKPGILALGIGLLVAFAVHRATGGRRGPELQVVAVGTALLGILIGKYLSFAFAAQEVLPGRRAASPARCSGSSATLCTTSSGSTTCSGSGSPAAAAWIGLQADDSRDGDRAARQSVPLPARPSRTGTRATRSTG